VSLVGAGTCTVNANQSGNASYQAAPQVQQSFTIGAPSQSIGFTSTPPASAVVGGPAYVVAATATSGLPVSFTADASSAGMCTVSGSTVSIGEKGVCIIYADQPGNANWLPAPQAQQSFRVKYPASLAAPLPQAGETRRLRQADLARNSCTISCGPTM